ncbi:MAG: hypothetical protein MUO97_09905, partial [Dehalococcoidia bacterium]|nr:hypothetical protein [Dehalococcoidia bacterium]
MFSPSDFRNLFKPNYCERRVWLASNQPDLALEDVEFNELLQGKGAAVEDAHVKVVGPIEKPIYPMGDMPSGFEETRRLIESKTPIIYQGVLMSRDGEFIAVPDLLILDEASGHYKIRDVKLATNLDRHPEIALGLGLCRLISEEVFGYTPIVEVATSDGQIISPFYVPDKDLVLEYVEQIINLENLPEEPLEPSGWAKCNPCPYFEYCWNLVWGGRDVCTIPGIEQGMSKVLWENRVKTWEDVVKLGIEKLAAIPFQRGSQIQRIGITRAEKIIRQARCLAEDTHEIKTPLTLPHDYVKGQRPIVVFDIENNIFKELGIQVDVYLWGLMVVVSEESQNQELTVSPPGSKGDYDGWRQFLSIVSEIFKNYGDVPIIHFGTHEKTWVNNYVERHGDVGRIGRRVLENLWDVYRALTSSVI